MLKRNQHQHITLIEGFDRPKPTIIISKLVVIIHKVNKNKDINLKIVNAIPYLLIFIIVKTIKYFKDFQILLLLLYNLFKITISNK
jgi:hypothetical protein